MAKEAAAVEADRRRAESEERARVAREKAKQRYIYIVTVLYFILHYTYGIIYVYTLNILYIVIMLYIGSLVLV